MKILLVLTSAVAVFTADYRDNPGTPESEPDYQLGDYNSADQNEHFPDNLVGSNAIEESKNINDELGVRSFAEEAEMFPAAVRDSTDEAQESIEGSASAILESFEAEEKHIKGRNGRKEMELRGKKQDDILKELSESLETFKYIMTHAYSELKVELESIREHQTNITDIGTEIKEEQHYIRDNQSNLTDIVTDFKVELNYIKEHQTNITDTGRELKEEQHYIRDNQNNLTDIVRELKVELQSIGNHQDNNTAELKSEINSLNLIMNNKTSLIISKLDSIGASRECPSDFFRPNSSNQCFKMFTDTTRSWANADAKCRQEGLMLAEPKDPVTVGLYFMNKYSLTRYTWVGGKGDGSYIRWQRNGGVVAPGSTLWFGGSSPGSAVTTSHCLTIHTHPSYMKAPWNEVYWSTRCTSSWYTMCELVNSG